MRREGTGDGFLLQEVTSHARHQFFGHRAVHVEEVGLLLATDQAIWNDAVANAQTIITKDEDFKNILLLVSAQTRPAVWVRIENCSNDAVVEWFQPLFPHILTHLQQGETLIELY